MKTKFLLTSILSIIMVGCASNQGPFDDTIAQCSEQLALLLDQSKAEDGTLLFPAAVSNEGEVVYDPMEEWRIGFFPGCLWKMYNLTGDQKWKDAAAQYSEAMSSAQYLTIHHDVGFMIGSSFLEGLRATKDTATWAPAVIQAAKSLSTRFRPVVGTIQSWNANADWKSSRGWACPVIIDNLMNLELMFEASILSGDDSFKEISISHADKTIENHFRDNFSCYHVVDYDPETGLVRRRCTAQGYADESSWARGQSWALYGYTMCYRYTRDERYLKQAEAVANFIFSDPNLPEDLIPYWDFNAPGIPNEPRDASAAAVIASALLELYTYDNNEEWLAKSDAILKSLCSEEYLAKVGENNNFILKHCVTSIPHNSEIDVPLIYADYYFLEAIQRRLAM